MRRVFTLLLLFFLSLQVWATHQRAGEITFRYLGGLSYEVTILTYTFTPSPADRPELEILWGDGTGSDLPRIQEVFLPDDIKRNVYVGQHTYPGLGEYKISVEDPNRNYGVLNIPNSVNIPLFIESLLVISPFMEPNNSPLLLLPPIDNGCTNLPYIHNPGAYDPDGDSLSFRLVVCRGAGGYDIPGYVLPNELPGNTGASLAIDAVTGDFVWDSPKMQGEYNIAILIEEWRNGIRIGYVTRDMQIIITACNNNPPVLQPVPDTCVVAGGIVDFDVTVTDPDGDIVTLTATGGPLVISDHPAEFDSVAGLTPLSSHFHWETVCNHVRSQPYQVFFKAKDNDQPVNLVALMTVNITVIGPPVPGLTAVPFGNTIQLTWNQSPCPNASGYSLYRRNGFYGYVPGYCETGVPAYTGYRKIAGLGSLASTSFTDDNEGAGLVPGQDYCYMIVADYPDGAVSIASEEVCATLRHDLPVIARASVRHTHSVNGFVLVAWAKPTELDPGQTPGPFKYFIYRSEPFGGSPILIDSLDGLNDTIYIDTNLNTATQQPGYLVGLLNNSPGNRFLVGTSQKASTVFLRIQPTDEELMLSWDYTVPWSNDSFVVYRRHPLTLLFDSLTTTYVPVYTDTGLVNGQSYCYRVRAVGHYSDTTIFRPLINDSQEACATPFDNVPPCPPVLDIRVECEQLTNVLRWTNPNHSCATDAAGYHIFHYPTGQSDFSLLATVTPAADTVYFHSGMNSIAGCYVVTAFDSTGNESGYSNQVCIDIDSCPGYRLPNVFTPNHDGVNDYFRPFPYHSVERIDLVLFNRWGVPVFKTTDPGINWDGRDMNTSQLCSDGVYYYVCEVYELRLKGIDKRRLTGIVHLVSGN